MSYHEPGFVDWSSLQCHLRVSEWRLRNWLIAAVTDWSLINRWLVAD
ncbi:hypothetical protein N692_14160 [Lactiplantibacillus plantarum EGD-AQ4]|nr:hypothetical protein N692_14160 [Lactiplantibacillus plantarum EGD-AQ4]